MAAIWAVVLSFLGRYWLYLALGGALLLGFRWWLVRHDDKIYKAGRAEGVVELDRKQQEEYRLKDDALKKAQESIASRAGEVAAAQQAIDKVRASLLADNQRSRALFQQQVEAGHAALSVPPNQRNGRIRSLLADLAATPPAIAQ